MSESRVTAAESDAIDQCPDCGALYVAGKNHRCPSGNVSRGGARTRDHRERRRAQDDNPADATVYVLNLGTGTKAYHKEGDTAGEPAAWCVTRSDVAGREWDSLTRGEAQAKRCYPCAVCHEGVGAYQEGQADV